MCCHLKGRCLRYCVLDIRKESHTGEVRAALWLRWLIGHFFERSTLQICVYFTSRTSFRHFLQIGLKRNLQLPCLLFFLLIAHISEVIIFSRESSYQSFLIDCLKRLNAHFLCQAGPKSILGSSAYFLPHILTPSQTILAPVVLIPDHWCPSSLCLQAGILSELCIHWTCCLSEMFTWSLEPQLSRSPTEFVISFLLCTDFFHFAIVGGHPAAAQKNQKSHPQPSLYFLLIPHKSVSFSSPHPRCQPFITISCQDNCKGPNLWSCVQSLTFSNHPLLAPTMIFLKCKAEHVIHLIELLKLLCLSTLNVRRVNESSQKEDQDPESSTY